MGQRAELKSYRIQQLPVKFCFTVNSMKIYKLIFLVQRVYSVSDKQLSEKEYSSFIKKCIKLSDSFQVETRASKWHNTFTSGTIPSPEQTSFFHEHHHSKRTKCREKQRILLLHADEMRRLVSRHAQDAGSLTSCNAVYPLTQACPTFHAWRDAFRHRMSPRAAAANKSDSSVSAFWFEVKPLVH